MEVRCKVCRFKFEAVFDETQVEMVVNCPRCGTPQVITNEPQQQAGRSSGKAPLVTIAPGTGRSQKAQNAETAQQPNAENAVTPTEPRRYDATPTPSASLKVDAYSPEEQKEGRHHVVAIIVAILLVICAYYAIQYFKQQRIESEREGQTLELFDASHHKVNRMK